MTQKTTILTRTATWDLNKTTLIALMLVPIVFIISYFLLSYYTDGDQIPYHNLYENLYGADIQDAVLLSVQFTSGAEPLSSGILWVGANLSIEKNIYISILNVILIVSFFMVLRRNLVKLPMIFLLLTNYYVVVLMTGAERLKIAYIFLVISVLFVGKARIFFLACTPFAHFQSVIVLASGAFANAAGLMNESKLKFCANKEGCYRIILFSVMSVIIGYFIFDGVKVKFDGYSESGSIADASNPLILFIIALYVSRKRFRMLLLALSFIPVVMAIGGSRVNMIAVTMVIYFLMEERRIHHPLVYILMLYLSFKTIGFVERVVSTGHGF